MFTDPEFDVSWVVLLYPYDLPWLVVGLFNGNGILRFLFIPILYDGLIGITEIALSFDYGVYKNDKFGKPMKLFSRALKLNVGELFLLFFRQFIRFFVLSLSFEYSLSILINFNFLWAIALASLIYSSFNYTWLGLVAVEVP